MDFSHLVRRAVQVRGQYAALETAKYGRSWTDEELTLGFVGDVGDLVKLVVARSGVRDISEVQEKLEHELADCLWSVIVLADRYEIDLEKAFLETMDDLEAHIAAVTAAPGE